MMDSFKVSEVRRMEEGGNQAWRDFWDNHPEGGGAGNKGVWTAVVPERYDGPVGEEYKERLACKVEGREFVPLPKKERKPAAASKSSTSGTSTPLAGAGGRASPAPARTASPALGGSRKDRNEAYFAKMGAENASRPDDLPPNQGGKYAGFGSGFVPEGSGRGVGGQGIPGVDEFQKDPMAAISKGFGWFTSAVGKSAKSVNDGFIQPNMQKVSSSSLFSCSFLFTLFTLYIVYGDCFVQIFYDVWHMFTCKMKDVVCL
jgi:ADP-ribosylation factor GTPase-activating protein 1